MNTREILFKALKADGSNEWVYGNLLQSEITVNDTCRCAITEKFADDYSLKVHEVIPETVGQFTGLTDKNGTRVFEGDRLRYTNHLDENGQPYYVHHIIQFSPKFNGWFAKHEHNLNGDDTQGDIQLWVYVKNIDFEVIGNIHQK